MKVNLNKSYRVNETHVCVLSFDKVTGRTEVDYIEISQPFLEEVLKLEKVASNPDTSESDLVELIKKEKTLLALQGRYNFCEDFSKPFQKMEFSFSELSVKSTKKEILSELKRYILAYSLNKVFIQIAEIERIKIFSHRMIGWSNPIFRVSENFSVEIKTNFGFGKKSYFYSKLIFRDLEIIPFSDLVNYEKSTYDEIINYTRKYSLKNDSWINAIQFVSDANNLLLSDKKAFFEKYVLFEMRTMCNGLVDLLKETTFSFESANGGRYKKSNLELSFKADKIVSSLGFISKIYQYKDYYDVNEFVETIKSCGSELKILLKNEISSHESKLHYCKRDIQELEPKLKKLEKENANFKDCYQTLKASIENNLTSGFAMVLSKNLEYEFCDEFPEYRRFKINYDSTIRNMRNHQSKANYHSGRINLFNGYIEKVKAYFQE
jgi:hypothetical protein